MIKQSNIKNYSCDVQTDDSGRELTVHGTALFPAQPYITDLSYEMIPWHWHDEMEIIIVDKGTANISVGSENFFVKAGQGVIVNSGALHSVTNGQEGESCFRSVVFSPSVVGETDTIFRQKYILPVTTNKSFTGLFLKGDAPDEKHMITDIDKGCSTMLTAGYGYEFMFRERISHVILELNRLIPPAIVKIKNHRNEERVKTMLLYIAERYNEDITLKDISGSANISESECLRCFRQILSISPVRYLKEYRLQKASELLLLTEDKIKTIALNCGFNDMSYFTKSFKEFKGMLPGDYRKINSYK